MNLRQAKQEDIPQLIELKKPKDEEHRLVFESSQIQRMLQVKREEAIYLVAEENNKIIGHVFIRLHGSQTEPEFPNMQDLYVDEDYRNKGVGSQLIQEVEKIVKEKGYTKVSLAVNPNLNPKARALYEKLGYKQTETKPYVDGVYDGVEDWCVDMVKDISNTTKQALYILCGYPFSGN